MFMQPLSTGGATSLWSITPFLSSGLTFDLNTGVLSGTPIEVFVRTEYAITASNEVGSHTFYVHITVEELHYELPFTSVYLLNNSMMDSLVPDLTIIGATYEIEPDLPAGLFFGMNNATIWGTPTELWALTNYTVFANNSLFSDTFEIQIAVLEDTDLDNLPDKLLGASNLQLIEDLDDDADGFTDVEELKCDSDPLDDESMPGDMDIDGICDHLDDDVDGDGWFNVIESDSGIYNSILDTGTDPRNPDTDGDGVCDGPKSPVASNCTAGPDAFPLDPAAHTDTDGDGMPDNLFGNSTSTPLLVLDLDDDNDDWSDLDEVACGTSPLDDTSIPVDTDDDGICDEFDDLLDLSFTLTYPSKSLALLVDQEMVNFMPNITGLGEVATWEISGELPEGLTFGWSPARDALLDGSIRGTPTAAMNMTNFTIWANNSAYSQSFDVSLTVSEEIADGVEIEEEDDVDVDEGFGWMWCFPCLILL
ncbi:MAG: hypothetical protein NLN65_07920, partial [Candidatus Poseidoniaceae archaeon]|nr:hypothetical protein [Candidatus Poseidoniaceae archaeon]